MLYAHRERLGAEIAELSAMLEHIELKVAAHASDPASDADTHVARCVPT